MGSENRYVVSWDDFGANLSSAFRAMRGQEPFYDIFLASEDGQTVLGTHRVLLLAMSPFFQTMLKSTAKVCKSIGSLEVVHLKGISARNLNHIIDFMYEGEVSVAPDDLESFLVAAEGLQIKGLTRRGQKNEDQQEEHQQSTSSGRDDTRKGVKRSRDSSIPPPSAAKVLATPAPKDENDKDSVDEPQITFQSTESYVDGPSMAMESTFDVGEEENAVNDRLEEEEEEGDKAFCPKEEQEENEDYGEEGDEHQLMTRDVEAGSSGYFFRKFIRANIDKTERGCICLLCGVMIKHACNVSRHFKNLHFDDGIKYFCPMCRKVYANRQKFSQHVYVRHRDWKGIDYKKYVHQEEM